MKTDDYKKACEYAGINFLEIMNQAVYDTMKNKKDDAYTYRVFSSIKIEKNKLLYFDT